MGFELPKMPSRSQVGYLDPEIAGEGQKVDYQGSVNFRPPPAKPSIPDWSGIKKIAHLFYPKEGIEPFPTWIYHPVEKARRVETREEARQYGVIYRNPTEEEKLKYNMTQGVWDSNSEWRVQPYPKDLEFDPANPGQGKTLVHTNVPQPSSAMIRELVPAVAAAVAKSLQVNGPQAPSHVDDKDWNDFLEFKAWKKTQEVVNVAAQEAKQEQPVAAEPEAVDQILEALVPASDTTNALNAGQDEKAILKAEAEKKGIKIDGRWSLQRLRDEVNKAA